MTVAQKVPAQSMIGRVARLPLRLIPERTVLRVVRGPCRGYRWISGSGVHGYWLGHFEASTVSFTVRSLRPGDVFLDVGANVGYFTLAASRAVGPEGHVIAFEPLPRNVWFLEKHLALNAIENTRVVPAAVSDRAGMGRFTLGPNPSQGSLLGPGDIDVRLVTLDEIVKQVGLRPPRFLKIDVEGAEPAVLLGARRLLEGSTAGVTLTAWEHMPTCREILLEHGYSIVEGGDCEIFALPPGWDGPQPDGPTLRRQRQIGDRP